MDIEKEFVHLVRFAVEKRDKDICAIARKVLNKLKSERNDLDSLIQTSLKLVSAKANTRSAQTIVLPVDQDSRLELLQRDAFPELPEETTWPTSIQEELNQILEERTKESQLFDAGLTPTKSILFVGPPGVGKTLAAQWLALKVGRPLLTLDLAAVMSSFLGRTGNNIRTVLDFAKKEPSVLLLDEFDAIAKRRDDATEIGELKRLVTVLLQTIDTWPSDGILLAATNHAELLDPAVWRRFEKIIQFPFPNEEETKKVIQSLFRQEKENIDNEIRILTYLFSGKSFADITGAINSIRRTAIVKQKSVIHTITQVAKKLFSEMPKNTKKKAACSLIKGGISQRKTAEVTGLSRDTIRKQQSIDAQFQT